MRRRWLRGLGIGVGLIVLLVAGLAAFGASQAREHEVSRTVTLPHPPATVFAILEDVAAYPCWRTGVERIEVHGEDPLRFTEVAGGDTMTFVIVERTSPTRWVSKIDGEDLPYGGTWTTTLRPEGEGTALTITERGFVNSVVLRGIAALFMDPTASITQFQADLLAHKHCDARG